MLASSRPSTRTRVEGKLIGLADEFRYLVCMPTKDRSYERDIQQRCAETNWDSALSPILGSRPPSSTKSGFDSTYPQSPYHDLRSGKLGQRQRW
ncbi:hypothetical protein RB195_007585 [Necator americanus]|uniref:Uncharacterized protein n=1 Tax=Necator americanus TaxID=51031 RepID=A0ABR1C0F5_NECAM